jgi:Flp pilus assembly protein TadB
MKALHQPTYNNRRQVSLRFSPYRPQIFAVARKEPTMSNRMLYAAPLSGVIIASLMLALGHPELVLPIAIIAIVWVIVWFALAYRYDIARGKGTCDESTHAEITFSVGD